MTHFSKLTFLIILLVSIPNVNAVIYGQDEMIELKESYLNDEGKYCSEVRFKEQIDRGMGTGWLVSERHLMTVGHLSMFPEICNNGVWLFNYYIPKGKDRFANIIDSSSVYRCKKIVAYQASFDEDFMIIELDKKVKGRTPLKLSQKTLGELDNLDLAMLSFSNGLPLKLSTNGIILSKDKKTFFTNLDNSGGASGSPRGWSLHCRSR